MPGPKTGGPAPILHNGVRNGPPPPQNMNDPNVKHKMVRDQLMRDCYSKYIIDKTGKRIPEIAYQGHIIIQEFSSYPSHPPPSNLPKDQIGSVKNRVLVICMKPSGRVILQKGKKNETKNIYQIGRTWDMDELKSISRAGNDGFMLSLNKDYYWRCYENFENLLKFIRSLATAYGNFVGSYPELNGWELQELKLNPLPKKHNSAPLMGNQRNEVEALRSKSLKQQPAESHYKDMDFTANGKLPMKPMKIMPTDRSGMDNESIASSNKSLPYGESKEFIENFIDDGKFQSPITPGHGNHPYQQRSPLHDEASINDSQSFIFSVDKASEKAPSIHEYAKQDGGSSPLRSYVPEKSDNKKISRRLDSPEPLERAAELGYRLEEQLDKDGVHSFEISKPPPINVKQSALSPDFGIEEVTDSDASAKKNYPPPDGKGLGLSSRKEVSPEIMGESTHLEGTIDTSIQEIEDFMDSQLHFGKNEKSRQIDTTINESTENSHHIATEEDLKEIIDEDMTPVDLSIGYSLEEDESLFNKHEQTDQDHEVEQALNINKEKSEKNQTEKDAELDELFDEVGWNINDTSDSLIKKFNKELNGIKHSNVKELVNLDFGMNSSSNDLKTSLTEIENLNHIFKKVEIDFNFLAPEINLIENNSKGLQVKSVNKKDLWRELKTILEKVSVNSNDLRSIEKFKSFNSLEYIPQLEQLLIGLYGTVNTKDISNIQALKQYQSNYQHVISVFLRHFNVFIRGQFPTIIAELSLRRERAFPNDVLTKLKMFLSYSGITYFIKSVSLIDFQDFKSFINGELDKFLEYHLSVKLKNIKYSDSISRLSQSIESTSIRKSRTLRLSVKRDKLMNKIGLNEDHGENQPVDIYEKKQKGNEIEDPKIIIKLINEAGDLISSIQLFLANFFHYDTTQDFNDFINRPFEDREQEYNQLSIHTIDEKNYSNDLISNMNTVFGNYINLFIKKITPTELIIPVLLIEIDLIFIQSQKRNQEFLAYSFLKKISEKFKGLWNKLIKSQVDLLNKATIKGKSGILPIIKNFNQLVFLTESSIQRSNVTEVQSMLSSSYKDLTEAVIHLCLRDDPLLKNNDHDDKERELRNVSIMRNIFFVTQQLSDLNTESSNKMQNQFDMVFKKVQDTYFEKLINHKIGKLSDFIKNYEMAAILGPSKSKRNDKKYLKTLLSNYTSKDIQLKAHEIFKKLEKYIISGEDMFEQDLLKKLWNDMESQFINLFYRLNNIVKSVDKDIDYNISKQEIHHIFSSIYSTR
ncbi:hypothetical protein HYPBUDRAFT_107838 [Hyphopichia burtonii NRRL Y-1933]|uniref:Exocyst complex component Sec3 PIP2-binding N-terminal domain-containing protein n=1 Tax=Hyphopichia burtonii NRRL Y-1933 TaxID=984485 RepID=A0A1E4RKU3_9ASCO|nr:hypothetical protein HYPBUDRAFT_107838 [Hyphopichia burtonii NRRL Y-1933]ODV67889.1 hypothetical protein HYPBUDRAFT_107838 [Hyphopichia burtonii NRRL Y-1933]